MSVLSQPEPKDPFLLNCRWAWCRSTFSSNSTLAHHVSEHVLHAIPVRRRDLPMIKRAEEGKGESFSLSELMIDRYSYSSGQLSSHKSAEPAQESSSSLPSPPASSPALHSPQTRLPGPAPSPSLHSMEQSERPEPTTSDDISRRNSPLLPSSKPLQKQTPPVNPTFTALSSPEPEHPHFLLEVPDSPLFSSLVKRPNKRKRTSNLGLVSHNEGHPQILHLRLDPEFPLHFHDRLHGSTSKAQTGLDPIAGAPLTPSSPASSPIFAVSTPVRQNWYQQPPLKRRKRSACSDKNSDPLPSKMESFVSPTKMFRSGTLQIKPTKHNLDALPSGANLQKNFATRSQSPFSESSHDSSDPPEIDSYPALQTQAPYQSQSLTQV